MRDILVLSMVLAILPFAIRHTWVAVLLWTWVSIMNPHKLAFGFAQSAPFAAIAACAALVSLLANRDRFKFPLSPAVVVLALFVVWMCITTIFAINPGPSWTQLSKILKIQLMTLIAMIALRERKHIEWFIWINVLSIGFYGFKGGIFTITTGGAGRVWGPAGGFIEGNNEIALAMVLTIPLMNYLRMVATRRWIRQGLLVLMLLSVIAAIGTQSRGAFLALSAMGLVLWMRSSRKFATGMAVAMVAMAVMAFMPSSWEDRMNTIQNYEQDASAMGRINAWWVTSKLANHRMTGGGFEIYTPEIFAQYAPDPTDIKVAHSIYFSVLGEHGYIGLFLFLLIWVLAFRTIGRIRSVAVDRPDTLWAHHLAGMCQVSLVGYAVGGAFLSLAYFDLPYNILVILVVSMRWLEEKRWNVDTQGALDAEAPTSKVRVATPQRINA
ncbi:MAG: putative O-glycosylation ligase, exosortase A system-associated [Rhodoferax sp.]|nr:putative O-glycosylation ligase, exosortase A system-associated [Rhodoferax sp.]MDP3652871.1 putative O-glycosylation ligase, exosortase A system-associated [Rhodoferax sp.]